VATTARLDAVSDAGADVTLRDLLAIEAFGLRLMTGTDRLGRPVRWAHSTELLDPGPYLRGDELVLTVGAALTSARACKRFAANVAAAGATAVGFGLGDVVDDVPPALVEACAEAGLALVTVPQGMPFLSITELLADRRAEARAARGRTLQLLVGRLLDAMGGDETLDGLLALVAAELGGQLTIRVGASGTSEPPATAELVPPGAASVAVPFPTPDEGELVWWALGPADIPPSVEVLDHLARVLALRRHEESVGRSRRRAELGRLIRMVLADLASPDVLLAEILPLGLDPQRVVVTAWPATAAPLVESRLGPALLAQTDDAVFSLSADASVCLALADEVALPCGTGTPGPVTSLRTGLAEALAALALSRRRGAPAGVDDLTSLEGLLEQQPGDRLAPFARQLIVPLVEHDARHGGQLVPTLRALLEHDGVNATARALYLHPNSLRHRLGRIAELTGRNPLDFGDRVALTIGLWAWDKRPRG
jgi:purine catabolism regulator